MIAGKMWQKLAPAQRQAEVIQYRKYGVRVLPWLWENNDCPDLCCLRAASGANSGPDWPKWRHATLLWMLQAAAEGVSLETIYAALRRFRAAEQQWCEAHGVMPRR